MNVTERLTKYYDFNPDILGRIEDVAAEQNRLSFAELAERYNIADGPEHPTTKYKPFEVLTLRPEYDYDEHHARVLHTSMATPVDAGVAMRALRLFASDPTSQLIVVGNPAVLGHKYNKLRLRDVLKVSHDNLTPTVEPHLTYLKSIGIESTDEIGYSWGADKAATASGVAAGYGIVVRNGVWMEPAAVVNRGVWQLKKDFESAEPELKNYIEACDSAPLQEAREQADTGFARYVGGLLRLSNLAITNTLAHDGFANRARIALLSQPELWAMTSYGTASELVPNDAAHEAVESLKNEPKIGHRAGELVLRGMHHAGCDDIDLHTAIVLQSLQHAA